jgi:hypothetical protein
MDARIQADSGLLRPESVREEGETSACAEEQAAHNGTAEPSMTTMPAPEACHQDLRAHIREATRVVREEIMREAGTPCVGAAWGACTPDRTGDRHGACTRDMASMEDVNMPRDRAGAFQTHIVDRSQRSEQQGADGLTRMWVSGTRTRTVKPGACVPCSPVPASSPSMGSMVACVMATQPLPRSWSRPWEVTWKDTQTPGRSMRVPKKTQTGGVASSAICARREWPRSSGS